MAPPDVTTGSVRFRDLGDLLVEHQGVARSPGGARPAAALATLLVHANRRVPVDVLSDAMWPDGPARSVSTLESHLWRLRRVLEPWRRSGEAPSLLITEPGGYRLVVTTDQVDSVRFAHLVEEAGACVAQGRPERAVRHCEQACELWRDRPFEPVAEQPWAVPAIARLEEYRTQLSERHVEALLAMGRPDRALPELESALGAHPLREHLWALRMLAAYRAGRTDDALEAYRRARTVLRDELGTEPSDELREMHRRVLNQDPGLDLLPDGPAAAPVRPGAGFANLPQWTDRLVGRDAELAHVAGLLSRRPLVTVTGPAGVGKTRLAAEAGRRTADAFPDGTWFVDLAAVRDAGQVADAVTTALGLVAPPTGSHRDALRAFVLDRRTLLVLDDCEHVVGEVAELANGLGRAAPELAVLVTSREPLGLDGEDVVELQPLALPGTDAEQAAAVELFLDRWAAAGGTAPDGARDEAARVCRAVDGIPLAIELAAARARAFGLTEIADQAEQDPGALSQLGSRRRGPRATVHAAVDRSYRLLDADERLLHRSVAVLPGPFTVRAAAAAAGIGDAAAADLLAGLVHRSLLVAHGPSRPGRRSRFAQLGIVRGHAARVLDEAGETGACLARRDAWITNTTTACLPRLGSAAERAWSAALEDDLPVLRGTLHRTLVERPDPDGAEIVAGLGVTFWYQNHAMLEGSRWIERAHELAVRDPDAVDRSTRGLLHLALAGVRAFSGRTDLAAPLCDRGMDELAAADGTESGHREPLVSDALVSLFMSLWLYRDHARSCRVRDAIAAAVERDPDPTLALLHHLVGGMTELGEREPDDLLAEFARAHTEAVALDNHFAAWVAAWVAQLTTLGTGDVHAALHWSDRCLEAIDRTGRRHAPLWLEMRANILAVLGHHEQALRLYQAARSHGGYAGVPWPNLPDTAELLKRTQASVSRDATERIYRDTRWLEVPELLAMTDP